MAGDYTENPTKRRRLSLLQGKLPLQIGHTTGVEGKYSPSSTIMGTHMDGTSDGESNITISSMSKLAGQAVAPFLAKHIPDQYAPLGGLENLSESVTKNSSTKYCYRHRPDLKCRRQANEPTMDELQHASSELYFLFHSD